MEKAPLIITSLFLSIFAVVVIYLIFSSYEPESVSEDKATLDVKTTELSEIKDEIKTSPNSKLDLKDLNLSNQGDKVQTQSEKLIPTNNNMEDTNQNKPFKKLTTQEKVTLAKPSMTIDPTKTYYAVISTTEGDIKVKLNAKETPITVNNFVYLANEGFYDDTIFHRVIKDFMIQGGDPLGNGTGGPAYKFEDEDFTGQYNRGTIAMANSGSDTNGSQFFIMHADYPLPPNYVIFGGVESGLEVVDKIATAEVRTSMSGEASAPVSPVKVVSVKIIEI